MKTTVTAAEIAHYRDRGYVIIEEFLPADELAAFTAAISQTVRQLGNRKMVGDGNERFRYDKEGQVDYTFLQRINLWKSNESIAAVLSAPELGEMLCELAGVDGFRIWHDHTLQKLPWANPTSWHLDGPNWSFHSRHVLSIWIALDDATVQNGCMHFVPGSHRSSQFDRNADFGTHVGALFDVYPEWRELEAVPIELKAGSASIHNGMIAHGAGPNMTPKPRRAMVCIYMPEGSTFSGVQNILSSEQMAELRVGDLLNDDEDHPLIWPV